MRYLIFMTFFTSHLLSFSQKLTTVMQSGHLGNITKIISFQGGKYIFSASEDYSVKLWNAHLRREVRTYSGHSKAVQAMDISPNDSVLVTGGIDHKIILWDIFSGKKMVVFDKHYQQITSIAYSPDGKYIASGGNDWNVLVWEVATQKVIHKIKVNPDKGTGEGISLQWHPNEESILVVGNDNYTIDFWNLSAEKVTKIKSVRTQKLGTCGGCPTKLVLSKGSKDYFIVANGSKLSKAQDTLLTTTLDVKFDDVFELQRVNNELFLVTNTGAFVYEVQGKQFKKKFELLTDSLFTGVFDGKQVIVGGKSGILQAFSLKTSKKIGDFSGFLNQKSEGKLKYDVTSRWEYYIYHYVRTLNPILVVSDSEVESTYLVKGKVGTAIRLLDLKSGISTNLLGHTREVLCLTNYKNILASGSGDKTIRLWDLTTKDSIKTLKGHTEIIFDVVFNEDGTELLSGSWDGTAKRWNVQTGECIATYRLKEGSPFSLTYTPNDLYFLTGSFAKKMELWEMDSQKKVLEWIGHTHIIQSLEWNKSHTEILSAGWDLSVRLWNWKNGLQLQKFKGHTDKVHKAIFWDNDQKIITASSDRTIRIWNVQTGKTLSILEGHSAPVVDLEVFNEYLFSSDMNGIVKIWNLSSGQELGSYISIGLKDWMFFTKNGYFDASENAKSYIFFVEGVKTYSLDQFFEKYYQPHLFRQLLTYDASYFKNNNNLIEELQNAPPPTITIVSPELGENFSDSGTQEFLVKIEDNGGGVEELKVLHNGKRIQIDSEGFHRKAKKGNILFKYVEVDLIEGVNHVEMSVFSKARIESEKEEREFNFENSGNKVNCYVVSIGINKYQNIDFNLNYAQNDAKSFSKMMKNAKELYQDIQFYELYNEKATKENIIDILEEIQKKARAEDVIYFYYAGHGTIYNHHFYLVPTNLTRLYEPKELRKYGVSAIELQQILQKINALKQVVILDACHSGGATKELGYRGALEEKAIAQLSRSAGVHILASAGSEQFATEFKELRHGVFTYALINAFEGKADGAPNDGKVTIYELKAYLDSQVPNLTTQHKGNAQYPHTFSTGSDFPVLLIKD